MRIGVLGDIMPSGVLNNQKIYVSKGLKNYLDCFDVRVATLESAIGDSPCLDYDKYLDKGEVCVWSQPLNLSKLLDLKINIVSLANNHVGDLGKSGLIALISKLDDLGIKHCGAGLNIEEAEQPVVIEKNKKTYAFIAICQNNKAFLGSVKYADKNDWGVLEFDKDKTLKLIISLKTKFDYVFVIAHWGLEFMWLPDEMIYLNSKILIDAGADAIIGGHPHQIQPNIIYDDKPIYFSLGNFMFPEIYVDENSNVFYPEKTEELELPTFNRFPVNKSFSMKYYWTSLGRKSMIADILVSKNKLESSYKLIKYNKSKLSLLNCDLFVNFKLFVFTFVCSKMNCNNFKKINTNISILRYLYFYKIKSIYNRKYRFFRYVKELDLK